MFDQIRSWLGIGRSRTSRATDPRRAARREDNATAGAVPIIAAGAVFADSDSHDGDGGFDGASGVGDASDSAGGWGGGDFGGGGDGGGAI